MNVKQVSAPLVVAHQEQFPASTISFDLAEGHSLGDALEAISRVEHEIDLPQTIVGVFSGDAAEFRKSLASEPYLILAAIVAIYIVLGVLYESFVHPFTVLTTLPSAGVGALLALMLFNLDMSIVALIGVVLLMGIVKKNAIMMIDFALDIEREEGAPPQELIVRAAKLRFRPIMMTTLAALLGALPLALSHGTGSELRIPLGVSIVGGLLLSQMLTLYTTPVIYLAVDRLRRRTFGPETTAPASQEDEVILLNTERRRSERFRRPSSCVPSARRCSRSALFLIGVVAYLFLPVASLPRGRLSDHRHLGVAARRRSRDDGGHGRRAAGAASRRYRGLDRAHLDEFARLDANHRAVRHVAQHRRRRARRAGGDQCGGADLPADLTSLPTLPQGQFLDARQSSFSRSPPSSMPTSAIYDATDTVIAQRISQVSGVGGVIVSGAEQPAIRVQMDPAATGVDGARTRHTSPPRF